jgi:hypothetical protein
MRNWSCRLPSVGGVVLRWQQSVHAATLSAAVHSSVGQLQVYCERSLEAEASELVRSVTAAIELIQTASSAQYSRLMRIRPTFLVKRAGSSSYWTELHTCVLDATTVMTADNATLAMKIVHESTHAYLASKGVPWQRELFDRVERVCLRREIAFCRSLEKLGFGVTERIKWYERRLEEKFYTPELKYYHRIRSAEAYGMPQWYVTLLKQLRRPS